MQLLDSSASNEALITLHADYIEGYNTNYRRWYFAQLDNAISQTQNPGLNRLESKRGAKRPAHEKSLATVQD